MFLWKKKEMLASSKKEYKIMKPLFFVWNSTFLIRTTWIK